MFSFLVLSTETSSLFYLYYKDRISWSASSCSDTKFERLNFDAIGTKVEPCALFLAPFGTSKRDPLLHLYVSTGWDFLNPGVSCLPVYIYIGAVQSHGTTVFLSLRCCASPSPGTTPLPVWVFDHCPTFLNCQVLFRFGFFFLPTALCLPSP